MTQDAGQLLDLSDHRQLVLSKKSARFLDARVPQRARRFFPLALWLALLAAPALSQRIAVDPYNSYHRVYAVVPVVGSGSSADPVHPLYAPSASEISAKTGYLAFTSVLSDDGRYALIEIVALQRSAFLKLLADKSVVAYEKGSVPPATIQAAFARYKLNFNFSNFNEVPVR